MNLSLRIPVGENYEKLKNARIVPPSFVTEEKQKRKPPFVYIDANIGHGKYEEKCYL